MENISLNDLGESISRHINRTFGNKHNYNTHYHGIQEKIEEERIKGINFYKENILEIYKDILGIELIDPDDFYHKVFKYYCTYLYKNHKKVPMKFGDTFLRLSTPLFEQCRQIIDIDNVYLMNDDQIQKYEKVREAEYFSKEYEKQYLQDEVNFNSIEIINLVADKVKMKSLKQKEIIDFVFSETKLLIDNKDCFAPVYYSFDDDSKFNIFFGETMLPLKVNFPEFYLNDELIDVKEVIKKNNNNYIDYVNLRKEIESFIKQEKLDGMHIRRASHSQIDFYYEGLCLPYSYEGNHLIRNDGSFITSYAVILEIIEKTRHICEQKRQSLEKAKKLFLSTLNKSQIQDMENKNVVFIEGVNFNYFIITEMIHHNLIQLPKNSLNINEAKVMCIISKSLDIPRFDVLGTISMLIKSGNEKIVNKTANFFKPNKEHLSYLENYLNINIAL